MFRYFWQICVLMCFVEGRSLPNDTAVMISKYAKVALWGQNDTQRVEGRSSGQNLWTHRSDVNVVSGQNLKKKPSVVYHYAQSKKSNDKTEIVPGIGEVIQERFNPKPYFKYGQIPEGGKEPLPNPSPTFNSFPVFNPPKNENAAKPQTDLYSSPFTSYNPPAANPAPADVGPIYPPNVAPSNSPAPTKDSYAAPPPEAATGGIYDYKPKNPPSPPAAPPTDDSSDDSPPPPPPEPEMNHHSNGGPPKHPPKSIDDIYYPPDDNQETIVDHPPMGPPPMAPEPPPDDSMEDHPPPLPPKPDMGEDDLSPPPTDHEEPRFPQYLYDQHPYHYEHHDHHIYEEVTHPPPTTPKEDERVNKGHYSYYYLGRKLWYIPLYFSVYFVIYVTVLILKSIARHKIQFRHHFEHDDRKARTLGLEDRVDEAHRNLTSALESTKAKYM